MAGARLTRGAFLLALWWSGAGAGAEVPATLRVDYFHGGSAGSEFFTLDQVVHEPLPWTGNMGHALDTTARGKYVFEILDPGTGEASWSRSFSSIYGEWETTGEARDIGRSFHESVRFPAPEGPFDLVISKRDAANRFDEVWRIRLDPDDYLVHRESNAYASRVVAVQESGDPATKVDLLLLGDGYTDEEHGAFLDRAKELTEVLFSTSPFRERRDDFNVWALAPAAAESGISRPSTNTYRDSPVGATYDAFRSERYILVFDNKRMRRIASSTPYDFVEVLVNSDVYGGGGIYGLYSTAAANSEWAPYLFVHEFGHHFAGLADEYYTSAVAYEAPAEITEPYEPNVTALLDPAELKWRHLVGPQTPLPTPWPKAEFEKHSLAVQERRAKMRAENVPEAEMNALFRYTKEYAESLFAKQPYRDAVGAFEGANYQAEGFFRPELNCLMFTRHEHFCSVCRAAIDAVIDEYAGSSR